MSETPEWVTKLLEPYKSQEAPLPLEGEEKKRLEEWARDKNYRYIDIKEFQPYNLAVGYEQLTFPAGLSSSDSESEQQAESSDSESEQQQAESSDSD